MTHLFDPQPYITGTTAPAKKRNPPPEPRVVIADGSRWALVACHGDPPLPYAHIVLATLQSGAIKTVCGRIGSTCS